MKTDQQINWDTVHTVAKSVVNNNSRRYLLSNAEADDCVQELTLQFSKYTPDGDLATWLSYWMRKALPRLIGTLRSGGLTGEINSALRLLDFDGPAPSDDPEWSKPGEVPPLLRDVLHTPGSQVDAEVEIAQLLSTLTAEERQLIEAYYGLGDAPPKTLAEVAGADSHDLKKVLRRIRSIQKKMLQHAKNMSESAPINSDMEELNATVRTVRHAEPKPGKDAGLLRVRTRHAALARSARIGRVRRRTRKLADATGT